MLAVTIRTNKNMKRLRTAISLTVLATLSGMLTAPVTSNAEWVQNPIGIPRAPGCEPGYSWQKLGVRYQCATPPPSCSTGFASGPAWNGNSWSYTCNSAPQNPAQPPNDPVNACIAAMSSQGYYGFSKQQEVQNYTPPNRTVSWMANGPYVDSGDGCGDMTHLYIMYCFVRPDSTVYQVNPAPQPENISCGGQGGN
jgi:hypothetical protein